MNSKIISSYVTAMLGGSKVNIELDDADLNEIIDQAIVKLRPHYSGIRYIQVQGPGPIDVSSHNILDVIKIYEVGTTGIDQLQSQMFLNPGVFIFNSDFKDNYISYLTYAKLASAYQTTNNLTWKFDHVHQLIYLSKDQEAVLECLVQLRVLSDIEPESNWVGWVKDYCLALAKICVGRKRSKYVLTNSQYQLDGDRLIQEGITERDSLESKLIGAFPIF